MNKNIQHYFWDSCVFSRYLTGEPEAHVSDIEQYIADAKNGLIQIHYSTIALAEIKPSHLVKRGFGDFNDFAKDFQGAFYPISPLPDVLLKASALRDFKYPNPNGGKDRILGLGDAIHLLTCIFAKEFLKLENIIFHTLDEGKGNSWEGNCVPLLTFEKYTDGVPNNPDVKKIIALKREKPIYKNGTLQLPYGEG